jgi:hypothetical protein
MIFIKENFFSDEKINQLFLLIEKALSLQSEEMKNGLKS